MPDFCSYSVVLENAQALAQVQTGLPFFFPLEKKKPCWFVSLFDNEVNLGTSLGLGSRVWVVLVTDRQCELLIRTEFLLFRGRIPLLLASCLRSFWEPQNSLERCLTSWPGGEWVSEQYDLQCRSLSSKRIPALGHVAGWSLANDLFSLSFCVPSLKWGEWDNKPSFPCRMVVRITEEPAHNGFSMVPQIWWGT